MSRFALRLPAAAFVVLFLVSVFLPSLPEGAYSDATVLGLYADSAERWRAEIAGIALVLAAMALLTFVAQAQAQALRGTDSSPSWQGRLAGAAGTAYAVMLMVTATAFYSLSAGVNIGELPVAAVTADAARIQAIVGFYGLLGPGSIAAGVMVVALSRHGRNAGLLPAWCARTGYVIGALCLVPAWPTQFLPPLWVLCAGLSHRTRTTDRAGQERRAVAV